MKPGPGDYDLKMRNNGGYESIEKKSFNKYYSNGKYGENEEKNRNEFVRKNSKANKLS